jgi:glucose-6-phosphate isomerase
MLFSQENAKSEEHAEAQGEISSFQDNLASCRSRLDGLMTHYRDNLLPHFKTYNDAANIEPIVAHLSPYKRVIVLATGGSSLGGQALCALASNAARDLVFADNLDPQSYAQLILSSDWQDTGFLVISKSGGTSETVVQFASLINHLNEKSIDIAAHGAVITGEADSTIGLLAARYALPLAPHEEALGGRYAVMSNVGLVPAALAGLEITKITAAADRCAGEFLAGTHHALTERVALHVAHLRAGRGQSVIMTYSDRLAKLGMWFRQLWAESLGKEGMGLTPIHAVGPVDQHSQLQLFIDGPDDKVYTIIYLDQTGLGPSAGDVVADTPSAWLAPFTIGDIVTAQARATINSLAARQRPVMDICLPHCDEDTIGYVMMHFMIETILVADLLGVNAFDQPGVEDAKQLTQKYLTQSAESS